MMMDTSTKCEMCEREDSFERFIPIEIVFAPESSEESRKPEVRVYYVCSRKCASAFDREWHDLAEFSQPAPKGWDFV